MFHSHSLSAAKLTGLKILTFCIGNHFLYLNIANYDCDSIVLDAHVAARRRRLPAGTFLFVSHICLLRSRETRSRQQS